MRGPLAVNAIRGGDSDLLGVIAMMVIVVPVAIIVHCKSYCPTHNE